MTLSLLVNNGKLTLAGSGKLPKTIDCCCDNPPPPYCLCPDFCSYKLRITSPISVETDFTCTQSLKEFYFGTGNQDPTPHPLALLGFTKTFETCLARPEIYVYGLASSLIRGRIEYNGGFSKYVFEFPSSYLIVASYTVRYELRVTCSKPSSTQAAAYNVRLTRFISCEARPMGTWDPRVLRQSSVYVDLPFTQYCARNDRAWCNMPYSYRGLQFAFLDQQSIELPNNNILWADVFPPQLIDTSGGAFDGVMRSAVDTMYDHCVAAPVTFAIAARSSCKLVACNCATSLTGLKVMFEGKEFVMGTEATVSESGAYLETWTHDAPGTFRYRKNDLSNNETYVEKEVEVYCQTDNAVSPPVDRWYAAFINWCKDEANYATTYNEDYFIGYFECEPASDCEPFSAETSIPTGSPIDVERVDGWPQGSGCTVPGPATITLSQDCG